MGGMVALFYYSLTVFSVTVCAIIWAICLSFIFLLSPASRALFPFNWGVAMIDDNGAHGSQWGACHCWLPLLPLFSFLAFLWFSKK